MCFHLNYLKIHNESIQVNGIIYHMLKVKNLPLKCPSDLVL